MRRQALQHMGQTAERKKSGDDSEGQRRRVTGAQQMLLSI